MDWMNPCNGLRWRTTDDGLIELEGMGVPMAEPGERGYENLQNTWRNWWWQFRVAGWEYGIPPAMLLAIATIETGPWAHDPQLQASIESGDGYGSIGIMQPLPGFASALGWDPDDRYIPLQNIRMAAKFASDNAQKYGLDFVSLAASHNAGSRKCGGDNAFNLVTYGDYLMHAVRYYNAAVYHLRANDPPWAALLVAAGVVGSAIYGYIIYAGRAEPFWR